jgi:hypothetical protein
VKHGVHELAREFRHPPAPARGAEAAPLARERDEQVERSARAAHPTEAMGEVGTGDDGIAVQSASSGMARSLAPKLYACSPV